jgi:hypothetical protein
MALISISENGKCQRLKNINAVREEPIHHKLLELGFIDFVASRRDKHGQLFSYKQREQTEVWSHQYGKPLSKRQDKPVMCPNEHPGQPHECLLFELYV